MGLTPLGRFVVPAVALPPTGGMPVALVVVPVVGVLFVAPGEDMGGGDPGAVVPVVVVPVVVVPGVPGVVVGPHGPAMVLLTAGATGVLGFIGTGVPTVCPGDVEG